MAFTTTAGSSTSPQDFSDMNVTDDDPIRRASPDHTMVAKTSNNGGYHAPTKTDTPLIVSSLIRQGRRELITLRDSGRAAPEEARVSHPVVLRHLESQGLKRRFAECNLLTRKTLV